MEVWKSVIGYEKLYEVSSFGRVRSLPRTTTRGVILKAREDKHGYENVCLCSKNNKKTFRSHVLVLEAFFGKRRKGFVGAHFDGNKLNNSAKNLRWVTPKENEAHKIIHGTVATGDRNGNSKKSRALRGIISNKK